MFGFDFYAHDRDDGFSIDDALEFFTVSTKASKKEKYLNKMLLNKNFYGFLFIKQDGARKEKTKELYSALCSYDNLRVIADTLRDCPVDEYPRSAATFLYSICTQIVAESNEVAANISDDYSDGRIRRYERDDKIDEVEKKFAYAKRINEHLNDMIKPYAKKLSRKSGIPKEACLDIVKSVPEKAYIEPRAVGGYMNIITDILYTKMDEYDVDGDIDWEVFFRMLFGNDLLKDVGMYLTVEGASRIERTWKNEDRIKAIWDSLTEFALDTLEDLDENDRCHVLDIYKKIVSSMAKDKRNDLRVDLTKIPEDIFPKIAHSVDKCYNELKEAVNIAKGKKDRIKKEGELPSLD